MWLCWGAVIFAISYLCSSLSNIPARWLCFKRLHVCEIENCQGETRRRLSPTWRPNSVLRLSFFIKEQWLIKREIFTFVLGDNFMLTDSYYATTKYYYFSSDHKAINDANYIEVRFNHTFKQKSHFFPDTHLLSKRAMKSPLWKTLKNVHRPLMRNDSLAVKHHPKSLKDIACFISAAWQVEVMKTQQSYNTWIQELRHLFGAESQQGRKNR